MLKILAGLMLLAAQAGATTSPVTVPVDRGETVVSTLKNAGATSIVWSSDGRYTTISWVDPPGGPVALSVPNVVALKSELRTVVQTMNDSANTQAQRIAAAFRAITILTILQALD